MWIEKRVEDIAGGPPICKGLEEEMVKQRSLRRSSRGHTRAIRKTISFIFNFGFKGHISTYVQVCYMDILHDVGVWGPVDSVIQLVNIVPNSFSTFEFLPLPSSSSQYLFLP